MAVCKIMSSNVPDNISGELLDSLLTQLPEWRLKKALSYHRPLDRFLCAEAYLLLKENLRRHFNLEENPEFTWAQSGKPQLAGHPDIHFSIIQDKYIISYIIGPEG